MILMIVTMIMIMTMVMVTASRPQRKVVTPQINAQTRPATRKSSRSRLVVTSYREGRNVLGTFKLVWGATIQGALPSLGLGTDTSQRCIQDKTEAMSHTRSLYLELNHC